MEKRSERRTISCRGEEPKGVSLNSVQAVVDMSVFLF